jgi:hypothetical protein
MSNTHLQSAGAKFRAAVAAEQPLQVVGAITAYAAKMAKPSASRPSTCRAAASRRIRSACRTWASARWKTC